MIWPRRAAALRNPSEILAWSATHAALSRLTRASAHKYLARYPLGVHGYAELELEQHNRLSRLANLETSCAHACALTFNFLYPVLEIETPRDAQSLSKATAEAPRDPKSPEESPNMRHNHDLV
jgi:hypothetical protein